MRWQVVIPQKPFAQAKSRLDLGPGFVEAMLRDVVAACDGFDVAVLGGDPRLASLGVDMLPDAGGGLSRAVASAVVGLRGPVAVLMGDLPCLTPAELARVLGLAEAVAFGAVSDAAGTGTTMLTALAGGQLLPSYGVGSFRRHLALGATDLLAGREPAPRLRRDVDTAADLTAAVRLGVGRATAAALSLRGLESVHLPAP